MPWGGRASEQPQLPNERVVQGILQNVTNPFVLQNKTIIARWKRWNEDWHHKVQFVNQEYELPPPLPHFNLWHLAWRIYRGMHRCMSKLRVASRFKPLRIGNEALLSWANRTSSFQHQFFLNDPFWTVQCSNVKRKHRPCSSFSPRNVHQMKPNSTANSPLQSQETFSASCFFAWRQQDFLWQHSVPYQCVCLWPTEPVHHLVAVNQSNTIDYPSEQKLRGNMKIENCRMIKTSTLQSVLWPLSPSRLTLRKLVYRAALSCQALLAKVNLNTGAFTSSRQKSPLSDHCPPSDWSTPPPLDGDFWDFFHSSGVWVVTWS